MILVSLLKAELGHLRPCVVVQNNIYNRSNIQTVIVCILTTNLKLGRAPGNITLLKGEGNLPKKSVVNISQIYTVNKSDLQDKIGVLPKKRVQEILESVKDIIEPRDSE